MLVDIKQVLDFHLQYALLCYLGHICVPLSERAKMIWQAHYSQVARHFGVEKMWLYYKSNFIGPNVD